MPVIEAPSAQSGVSAVAVRVITDADPELSERVLVDQVVAQVLAQFPTGAALDSLAVADALFARRLSRGSTDAQPVQTKDYTQYLLRETAANVCRHADGHHYRIHPAKSCGTDCDAKWAHSPPEQKRPSCEACYLELTTAGECPMGC